MKPVSCGAAFHWSSLSAQKRPRWQPYPHLGDYLEAFFITLKEEPSLYLCLRPQPRAGWPAWSHYFLWPLACHVLGSLDHLGQYRHLSGYFQRHQPLGGISIVTMLLNADERCGRRFLGVLSSRSKESFLIVPSLAHDTSSFIGHHQN